MMVGIGVDLVSVDRITRLWMRYGDRFVSRILTLSEIQVFTQRKQAMAYLSSRFAAKEAFSKAIGTGFYPPFSFQNVSIHSTLQGAPLLRLQGALKAWADQRGVTHLQLSLSDTDCCALALVVLSGSDNSLKSL